MSRLRRAVQRLRNTIWPDPAAEQWSREVEAHLALLADDLERRGYPPGQARAEARRRFGSVASAQDRHRDARSFVWIEDCRRDLRFALRMLRRSPGFTAVAVLTLGVGIGANTIVFTVTNAVLFKGFPLVARNDRLVYITSGRGCCVSYPDFLDWQAQARSLSGMALVHGTGVTISGDGAGSELVAATEVTANTFTLAGRRPLLGRDFSASDAQRGAPPVVMLRHGFWQRRFASDPAIVGRTLRVNGTPATIIGVMPRGFSFPQNQDVWVPLPPAPEASRDDRPNWFALGRLAEGVELRQVRAEMAEIGRRLGAAYPDTNQGRSLVPFVSTFEDFFVGARAAAIYRAMWGAVAFVLLIACANLANLLLARALARSREISVRVAIGAGRGRVVRQLLVESVLLSAIGGLVGWWIARWGVAVYAAAANGSGISEETLGVWFMNVLDYSMDYRAFAYLAVVSLSTGVVFGLIPALRLSALDPAGGLTDGTRGVTMDRRTRRLSWALVSSEMALAVVLVAGSGMLVRSFWSLYAADPGFDASRIVGMQIRLPADRFPEGEPRQQAFDRLLARLDATPGIRATAFASARPGWSLAPREFAIEGAATVEDQMRPVAGTVTVGGEYFRTLGLRPLAGRDFLESDGRERTLVAIVNEPFARRYFPDGAVGQRLRLVVRSGPEPWVTIVGVVPPVVQNRDLQQRDPVLYLPARQRDLFDAWVLARTDAAGTSLADDLRRQVAAVDPDLPVADGPATLAEYMARNYQFRAVVTMLFGLFAVIALLLAALGLYAVIAHTVWERTREIGIRTAVGATRGDILRLVLSQGMRAVVAGLAAGFLAAAVLGRVLEGEFAQVVPSDPLILLLAVSILLVAAIAGCVVPARRALSVDPAVALRPVD